MVWKAWLPTSRSAHWTFCSKPWAASPTTQPRASRAPARHKASSGPPSISRFFPLRCPTPLALHPSRSPVSTPRPLVLLLSHCDLTTTTTATDPGPSRLHDCGSLLPLTLPATPFTHSFIHSLSFISFVQFRTGIPVQAAGTGRSRYCATHSVPSGAECVGACPSLPFLCLNQFPSSVSFFTIPRPPNNNLLYLPTQTYHPPVESI